MKEFGSSASKSWVIHSALQTTWNLNFHFIVGVSSQRHNPPVFGRIFPFQSAPPVSGTQSAVVLLTEQESHETSKMYSSKFQIPEWKRVPVSYGKF